MEGSVTINMPNLIGLTQSAAEEKLQIVGLLLGNVTKGSSSTVAVGNVSDTRPPAGVTIDAGSAVDLEVSSGPADADARIAGLIQPTSASAVPNGTSQKANGSVQQPPLIAVPDVVGLTRSAARTILENAGLNIGPVKAHESDSVPAGGISDIHPDAGTLVKPGSSVELDVSTGPKPSWTQYIFPGALTILGLTVLGVIIYGTVQHGFLDSLGNREKARGLITFLIAISTVGIAIILAISTLVLAPGDEGDKRFDRGKQVLSVLIGVLGTIVGFYFGAETKAEATTPTAETQTFTHIVTDKLPDGTANQPYAATTLKTRGLLPPLKWAVDPQLPEGLTWDNAAGTIRGTPKAPSKKQYTFAVTDSASPPVSDARKIDLEIKSQ